MTTTVTKHTSGPWRVVGPYIASESERVVAKFCDNNTAGPVWAGTPADLVTAANGRVLAAAPDMLAALESIRRELRELQRGAGLLSCSAATRALVETQAVKCDEAIAKAGISQ